MTAVVGLVIAGGLLALLGRLRVQVQSPGVIPWWVTGLESLRELLLPVLLVVSPMVGGWAWLASGVVVAIVGVRIARDARLQAAEAALGRRELEARRLLRRPSPPEIELLSTPITTSDALVAEERRVMRQLRDAMAARRG